MAIRKIAPKDFELEASFAPIVFTKLPTGAPFNGVPKESLDKAFNEMGIDPKLGLKDFSLPIALRWRTSTRLGLPLTVFNVWRRSSTKRSLTTVAEVRVTASGVQFNNGPFVSIAGQVHNKSNLDLTVKLYPKNSDLQNYASKDFSVFVTAGATATFAIDQPNMYGLESSSPGQIEFISLRGILVSDYIVDKDWELIQKVGLPAEKGYIDNALYDYEEQGFINALQPAFDAAVTRLTLQQMFYIDSPPTAADGASMPVWKAPDAHELVKTYSLTAPISNGVTGMLNDIREMFDRVYNVSPAFYNGQQKLYTKTIKDFGMYDEANPSPKQNGTYLHPVCAATLLSVSSDSWNALGLGFGTTDLVPYDQSYTNPKKYNLGPYDYMVTAEFRQPITELVIDNMFTVKEKFLGIDIIEYAALCSYDIDLPLAPPSLLAEPMLENRPLRMDDYYYQQERISWLHQDIQKKHPLVFSILFYNAITGSIRYLNQARPFLPANPQPLLPAARSDAAAADAIGRDGLLYDRFIHDKAPLPLTGNVNHKYYVAAQDVFGLWSKWSDCVQNLVAKPPQKPDIISARFTNLLQTVNPAINQATLEIIFNWHWDDRSPFEVRFTGHFFVPPVPYTDPAPWPMAGIALGDSTVKRYAVRFAVSGVPSVFEILPFDVYQPVPVSEAAVIDENTFVTGNGNGTPHTGVDDTRAYKLSLFQMQLNFTTASKLYYSIEALGIEAVNPGVESSSTRPYVISTVDPNPKVPPVFFTEIKWASLPDIDNVSRYHLKFDAIPGAVGYAIYRATETSLRAKFLDPRDYPDQGNIFQRRNVLELTTDADKTRGLDAFIRVNKELLKNSEHGVELEMNGDVGGLYIYAVSSFSEQNVESKLSNWIYVAVPQRITPGIPTITGYINKKLATPKLVLRVNVGPGDNTDAVQLYKTGKTNLARDLNIMGLPVSTGPGNTGWAKYRSASPADILITDPTARYDYLLYEEELQPTWQTIFLRTASLGKNSPADGLFPGRSASSNLLELVPPIPAALAQIINATIVPTTTTLQLSFNTNAFVGSSNYGNHLITILQQDTDGIFKEIIKKEIPVIPKLTSGTAEAVDQLYRLEKDSSDFTLYHFSIALVNKVEMQIKVTDPAGRNTVQLVSYEKPPVPPTTGIVIKDVKVKVQLATVLIEFKTNVSKRPPLLLMKGTFLTVAVKPELGADKILVHTQFHLIPNKLALLESGVYGGRIKDADGFYTYDVLLRTADAVLAVGSGKAISITIKPFKKAAVINDTRL